MPAINLVAIVVAAVCLVTARPAVAQSVDALTRRLQSEAGLPRAQTLAALTDALRQSNPKQAIAYGHEALSLFATHPDPAGQVRTLNEMAWAYMTLSDYANAVSSAEKGRAVANQHGDIRGRGRALNNLGVIAQRRGDAVQAVEFFTQALADYGQVSADLDQRYEAERRESGIAMLRADQATAALQHREQQMQRNAILAGAVVLGLLAIGLYGRGVERTRMSERLSVTDSLTGLKNRRYVLQTVEADASVSVRKHRVRVASGGGVPENSDLVFVVIDIDQFKQVNDQYGQQAGDKVLIQVADVLRSSCRTSDTIARWGGEEFLVIFRFTSRETAALSVERIRMAVEQHVFDIGGGRKIRRTCSIGFAPYPLVPERPDEATWEQVLILADQALNSAKESGLNAWLGADPSLYRAV